MSFLFIQKMTRARLKTMVHNFGAMEHHKSNFQWPTKHLLHFKVPFRPLLYRDKYVIESFLDAYVANQHYLLQIKKFDGPPKGVPMLRNTVLDSHTFFLHRTARAKPDISDLEKKIHFSFLPQKQIVLGSCFLFYFLSFVI